MNVDLTDLYQQLVLEHAKSPRNRGRLEGDDIYRAEGHNPLCGDKVRVDLAVENDRIGRVAFESEGCAISTASASLMTDLISGKTTDEARAVFEAFRSLVTGESRPGDTPESIEMLAGVSRFPMRIKCATLAWHTMLRALDHPNEPAPPRVTTE